MVVSLTQHNGRTHSAIAPDFCEADFIQAAGVLYSREYARRQAYKKLLRERSANEI